MKMNAFSSGVGVATVFSFCRHSISSSKSQNSTTERDDKENFMGFSFFFFFSLHLGDIKIRGNFL